MQTRISRISGNQIANQPGQGTMRFEITPHKGAGPIEFGMTVDQVRALLGAPSSSFKRSPLSKHPLDLFENAGLFVSYDSKGSVEALEFDDRAETIFNGIILQTLSPKEVMSFLQNARADFKESIDGIMSMELGISFWFPDKVEELIISATSILVFRRGYFDQNAA